MAGKSEVTGWKTTSDGRRLQMSQEECEVLLSEIAKQKEETERLMPDEKSARQMMARAHARLKDFGWRDAIYCPKDGRMFQVIEAGSSGIHMANYEGQWPGGGWWIYDGDVWPSRPTLFRLNPEIKDDLPLPFPGS